MPKAKPRDPGPTWIRNKSGVYRLRGQATAEEIVAEGGIAPYVSITQPSFPRVFRRGTSVSFDITVSPPPGASAGEYDGELMLKRIRRKGRVTQVWRAEALPVILTISVDTLPPDPGEEGKITLEGIDSDGDGVRDDIQRYIALTYPESPDVQSGLITLAIALQQELVTTDTGMSRAAIVQSIDDYVDGSLCLKGIMGRKDGLKASKDLKSAFLNTEFRSLTYFKSLQSYAGTVRDAVPYDEYLIKCTFTVQGNRAED